jgi:hypothetical protein
MTCRNSRFGKTLRAVLVVMFVLISMPVLIIGAWRVQSVEADDNRYLRILSGNEQQLNESGPIGLPGPPHLPEPGVQYRPVIETSYRDETATVMVPEFDPETGKQVMRMREVVRKVPVQTTRWVKSYTTTTESAHAQRTMQLANELRLMKEDDESRESKLKELRTHLEREFTELHQKQLAEIERTEKRLESLKALHDKRGENKNNIVERRIDELLGKADPLRWNVSPVLPTPQISQPAPQSVKGQNRSGIFRQFPTPHDPEQTLPIPVPPRTDPGPVTAGKVLRVPLSPDRIATIDKVREYEIQRPGTPNLDTPNSDTQKPGYQDGRLGPLADAAPTSTFQNGPLPAFAQQPLGTQLRVGVPNSALGEVFQLARNSANAKAELAEAEIAYKQSKELRSKGAIPFFEFQKAELKFEKCKREVKLIDMQLEALSAAMDRGHDLAKSTLARASSNLAAITAGTERGINSEQDLVNAKYEVEKAEKALRDAVENISTLKKTIATVKGFGDEETDERFSDDAAPAVQTDSEESSADEADASRAP